MVDVTATEMIDRALIKLGNVVNVKTKAKTEYAEAINCALNINGDQIILNPFLSPQLNLWKMMKMKALIMTNTRRL